MSKARDIADRKLDGTDLELGDNDKAVFGDGSDLQIYHDGYNSYVTDSGTGELRLRGETGVKIQNTSGSATLANFTSGGSADLYHGNAVKLATAATGVDVTGAVDASTGYKLGSNWATVTMGRAYHKFTIGSSTTTKSATVWNPVSGSTMTYTKKKTSSLLAVTGLIDVGLAVQNASGTNHGYVDARLKITAAGRTTTYTAPSRGWFRIDAFTGIYESTRLVPLEWTSDTVFEAGDNISVSVEYMFYQTAGTQYLRGGVNTWQSGSYLEIHEYDWGH